MLEFIRSWKFMAIIVALLVVCVGGLLAYGIGTHDEPGFMEETIDWDRGVPIGVCVEAYGDAPLDDSLAYSLAHDAVARAIDVTNERLGFEVYSLDPDYVDAPGGCYVSVMVGVPAGDGWMDPGGDALLLGASCEIRTANTGTTEILSLVLQHELGHCLGLAHDGFEVSIMRRVQVPTPDGEFPPRITDHDRALIISRYASQFRDE